MLRHSKGDLMEQATPPILRVDDEPEALDHLQRARVAADQDWDGDCLPLLDKTSPYSRCLHSGQMPWLN